jgi:hypothetical protein
VCDLDDFVAELLPYGIGLGWVAIAVARDPHRPAGAPLAQESHLLDHGGNARALGLWG